MTKVRMVRDFTYRKSLFEEGKVYELEDKPEGFIQHWMVKNGYGEVLEDSDEEAEADPRTVPPEPASEDEANAKQRRAEKAKRAEAVEHPPLKEGEYTKSRDFFGSDKSKPAGAQEAVENPPEDMIQGEGGTFASPAVTAEEDSSEHTGSVDQDSAEGDDKASRPKLKDSHKDHGKRHK